MFWISLDFFRKSYKEDNLEPQDILTLMFSFKNIGSYKSTNLAVSETDKQDIREPKMLKENYLMKLIRKIIVYIICLFSIFNYTYGFENKIEFQLANKSFTSNDLERRENYLKFVGDNSQISKKEIIDDYVSVLIFTNTI